MEFFLCSTREVVFKERKKNKNISYVASKQKHHASVHVQIINVLRITRGALKKYVKSRQNTATACPIEINYLTLFKPGKL